MDRLDRPTSESETLRIDLLLVRGYTERFTGAWPTALETYRQAETLARARGDESRLAASYNNIGLIYEARGDYDQALDWFQQSVAINEKLGDLSDLATSYNNIATVHHARGDYDRAIAMFERSVTILERLGERANAATVRANLERARQEAHSGPSKKDSGQN